MRRLMWAAPGVLAALAGALAATVSAPSGAVPRPAAGTSPYRATVQAQAAVTATVPDGDGAIVVRAVVDQRRHRAVGSYEGAGGGAGLVAWDRYGLAVAPSGIAIRTPEAAARAAREVPTGAWNGRDYTTGALDRALRLVMTPRRHRPDDSTGLHDDRYGGGYGGPGVVEFATPGLGTTVPELRRRTGGRY